MDKQAYAKWRFFRSGLAVVSWSSRPQRASCLSHHLSEGLALSGLNAVVLGEALGSAENPGLLQRPNEDTSPQTLRTPSDPGARLPARLPRAALLPQGTAPLSAHGARALWFPGQISLNRSHAA